MVHVITSQIYGLRWILRHLTDEFSEKFKNTFRKLNFISRCIPHYFSSRLDYEAIFEYWILLVCRKYEYFTHNLWAFLRNLQVSLRTTTDYQLCEVRLGWRNWITEFIDLKNVWDLPKRKIIRIRLKSVIFQFGITFEHLQQKLITLLIGTLVGKTEHVRLMPNVISFQEEDWRTKIWKIKDNIKLRKYGVLMITNNHNHNLGTSVTV